MGLGVGVFDLADGVTFPPTSPTFSDFFWMCPEIMEAHRGAELVVPTKAGDIWSFGLLAFEVSTV